MRIGGLRRRGKTACTGVAAALLIAGCSGGGERIDSVPGEQRTARMATSVGLAPYEVLGADGKTVEGFEPDYVNEMARRAGVQLEWIPTNYESLMPGVSSGRYDIAGNGMFNTQARSEQFDMLNYFADSSVLLVTRGNPLGIKGFDDVCGRTVAVQAGSKYPDTVARLSQEHCESSGRPAIMTISYGDPAGHVLLMQQGRADATATARLVADYASHIGGTDLEPVDTTTFDETTYALIFPKGSPLVEPFRHALQTMIDDGTYATISDRWGLQGGRIATATIGMPPEGK